MLLLALMMMAVPVFAQDEEGDDDDVMELPTGYEEVVTEDEMLSFFVPEEGWFYQSEGPTIVLTNSETALDSASDEGYVFQEGEVGVTIVFFPSALMELLGSVMGEEITEESAIALFETLFSDVGYTVSEVEIIPQDEEDEEAGTFVTGDLLTENEEEGFVYLLEEEGIFVVAVALFGEGAEAEETTVDTILASLDWEYTEEELAELYGLGEMPDDMMEETTPEPEETEEADG
jgi:hypothetical protein